MTTTNAAPPSNEDDERFRFRYPKTTEIHKFKTCGWVFHRRRPGRIIERHFVRVCHCKDDTDGTDRQRYTDRRDYLKLEIDDAPSQAVNRVDPEYGYDIHFSPDCEWTEPKETVDGYATTRICQCSTPPGWNGHSTFNGRSTHHTTNIVPLQPHPKFVGG